MALVLVLAATSRMRVEAIELFSSPRGIYTVKVAGKSVGKSQARTYFGIQLLPDIRFSGNASSVSGDTLVLNGGGSHTAYADPERKCYLHVLSGDGRGFIADIEEFRANAIRCSKDLTAWVSPGTQVQIRPHSNLGDLLGADNRFGLASGPHAQTADNVVAWNPSAGAEKVYYFHSTRLRWEEQGIQADASHAIMRFPYGIYIIRRSASSLRVSLSGNVAAQPVLLQVRMGANVFSLPVNLSASLENLISLSGVHSVAKGSNSSQADLLEFVQSSTGSRFGPFYGSSRIGSEGWREVGVNDNAAAIQALDPLSTLILRRSAPDGYVLAEGNLIPGAALATVPSDPGQGEIPLVGELKIPSNFPGNWIYSVQTSTDLQTWTLAGSITKYADRVTFPLPPGQNRAFYRIKIDSSF